MKFLYRKYQAKKKEIIKVTIDRKTKVKFLTAHDFRLYQKGKTHRYFGGTFDSGEVRFVLPFDSVWHAVVEQGTYNSPLDVRASCSLCGPDRDVRSSIALDAPEPLDNGTDRVVEAADDTIEGIVDDAENTVDEIVQKGEELGD